LKLVKHVLQKAFGPPKGGSEKRIGPPEGGP
jgi:hypothetical protein